jgi:acetyl-CoA carboxylase carboxyltransferase component
LFDARSFVEREPDEESSCIVGWGFVDGRKTYLVADAPYAEVPKDFATLHGKKLRLLHEVHEDPHPLIVLADAFRVYHPKSLFIATPGFPEFLLGKTSATAYLRELGKLTGVVPMVALTVGNLFGGGTLNAPFCDAYVFARNQRVTFSRPELYKKMTGDATGVESLGCAEMHCAVSGLGDALVETHADGVAWIKRYLSYFPPSYRELPPVVTNGPARRDGSDLRIEPTIPFDIRKLIAAFTDPGSFLEIKELYAREVAVGFARLGGVTIGVIGNNSKVKSGAIFPDTCRKMAKFISLCDAFSIPLVILADTPGFGVGLGLDQAGAISAAAQVSKLLARSTVPKALVIVRNAFGGGVFMAGPGLVDTVVAFPHAKIGPFGALTIRPPETPYEADALVDMQALTDMRRLLERGLIDDIVEPPNLHDYLHRFLRAQTRIAPASPRGVLCA